MLHTKRVFDYFHIDNGELKYALIIVCIDLLVKTVLIRDIF